jgi:REP element-mobilizing transposase RayT
MYGKRKSIRLEGYDYSQEGLYFVTIDLENKKNLLWKDNYIDEDLQKINKIGRMDIDKIGRTHRSARTLNSLNQLNDIGLMIGYWWNEIPNHFKNIKIDEYIIMPNHIHGILIINNMVGADRCVRPIDNKNGPNDKKNNSKLGDIIQWFKTMTTNEYIKNVKNKNWPRFFKRLWQRDYYERIIRGKREYLGIKQYIKNNPKKLLTKIPREIGGF